MELSDERLIWMYRTMLTIRTFEEKITALFAKGQLPGFLHAAIGQEAVSVGACASLREDDYITSTHRGHGDVIAKGADLNKMMAELFAKQTGYCRAKGGSMHIASFDLGILGANGIVGGGIPIATGAGLSALLRGSGQVTLCFFGDGAASTGAFHESLNLASVWNLPVVFVCVNNLYAESTPIRMQHKIDHISTRAAGYAMPGFTVDGNDVLAVYDVISEAVNRARRAEGPTLVECLTYRWTGHTTYDPCLYRPPGELEEWKKKDPILRYRNRLVADGLLTEHQADLMVEEVSEAIEASVRYAIQSPTPPVTDALRDVYTEME